MQTKYTGKVIGAFFITLMFFSSCKKDNYDPPSVMLTGQLAYEGAPIGVEQDQVSFQLQQTGFSTPAPIDGVFDQNGKLSMQLFAGNYKLIIPDGQGPFVWNKTGENNSGALDLVINSNTTVDLPIIPYFMIRDGQINNTGKNVKASFRLEKVINDARAKDIEYVALYVNRTQFVSAAGEGKIAEATNNQVEDLNAITLNLTIPESLSQNYVFARIGVKIAGVEDMLYSPVQKITY